MTLSIFTPPFSSSSSSVTVTPQNADVLLQRENDTAADNNNTLAFTDNTTACFNGNEHEHFYPLLPYSFTASSRLALDGWSHSLSQSCAGSITLCKDLDLPTPSRVVSLNCDAGEITGICLCFPPPSHYIGTPLPILNFQLKHVDRFVEFAVDVMDETGLTRTFSVTNRASVARITEDQCRMTLKLKKGWNKLSLDLAALTQKVFNVSYLHALRVRLYATCRVRRVYFSDTEYADYQLPSCLRVGPSAQTPTNDSNSKKLT